MPIDGNLKEFPLPEVLLFIGGRTGRLRLYDVPNFAVMEIDLADGQAHALHLGGILLTETSEIVAELSVIIETGEGMFEFTAQPVEPVPRERPFLISDLVMSLVVQVDTKLSQRNASSSSPKHFYVLELPAPEIWIDPNLRMFYHQSMETLRHGMQSAELAEKLGLEEDVVRLNLTYLRQLGFVKIVDGAEAEEIRQQKLQSAISEQSSKYQFAAEASNLIMRSGKIFKLPPLPSKQA